MIKIELELNDLNVVMQALGQMPYAQVEPLVKNIREQAIPQVQQTQQEPQADEPQ